MDLYVLLVLVIIQVPYLVMKLSTEMDFVLVNLTIPVLFAMSVQIDFMDQLVYLAIVMFLVQLVMIKWLEMETAVV
jgi:hypothetical protein